MDKNDQNYPENAIALVGIACRFPGAGNLDEFWANLCEGRESISFFSPEELDKTLDPDLVKRSNYVRAKGVLADVDKFDAKFFGVSPIEANVMDPQQRLLLELAWASMEDAGIIPGEGDDVVGVWVGTNWNRYYANNVRGSSAEQHFGEFNTQVANEFDFPASRISYKLNLTGPSITMASACSTSLVGIGLAMQSLLNYECDVALAGGASVIVPLNSGYLYQEGSMLSSDGHCRPFDVNATGTTFNDGVGVVTLKRLEDAIEDGDRIYAVVRGVGINNDGSDKVSYTAPSVSGQVGALRAALAVSEVDPATVQYIETHGTATPLGDPIEVAAIKAVYGQDGSAPPCALGSVKSNIGHAIHAAGVAGFIKAALAVRDGILPPTLHFKDPNPELGLENTRFYVSAEAREWHSEGPRRAAISAFGVGGTNAHVIVEQPPAACLREPSKGQGVPLLLLSGKDPDTALEQVHNLAAFVKDHKHPQSLGDIGYTLVHARARFDSRAAIFAPSLDALSAMEPGSDRVVRNKARKLERLAFAFPGQGAQVTGMGAGLIETSTAYATALDRCIEIANRHLDIDLRDLLVAPGDDERISQTVYTQPALFAVGYALACHYESLGIKPDVLIGHSIGEFAAACLAGVFSLEDGVNLVCARGRIMQAQPKGSMLAVSAAPEAVEAFLGDDVALAAHNAPGLCVIAGETERLEEIAAELEEKELRVTMLRTSHAFHSHMMDGALPEFREVASAIRLSPPQIPIVSTVTGRVMTDEEATSVEYWVGQLRNPVQFSDAVATLLEAGDGGVALLELGPGRTLASLFRQQADNAHFAASALEFAHGDDHASSWLALGALWSAGLELPTRDWWPETEYHRTDLPTYAFRRDSHWIEPTPRQQVRADAAEVEGEFEEKTVTLRERLIELFNETTGMSLGGPDTSEPFTELGLDSLLLTQIAAAIQDVFEVSVTIKDLVNDLNTLDAVYQRLEAEVPQTQAPKKEAAPSGDGRLSIQSKIERAARPRKQTGARRRDSRPHVVGSWADLGKDRETALRAFIEKYSAKTAGSKAHTDQYRLPHADPRTASGFHRVWKEIAYPLVCNRSDGAFLWDIDDNRYIDLLSGFGPNMLGHSDALIRQAIETQLAAGIEIGPQTPLAGETAGLVCQLTGMDRASFMCTGSEAVQAALRCARTVTRRSKIVLFEGAYHGNFDEVLVRGANSPGQLHTIPASPGVPRSSVADVIVLPWAAASSLEVIDELGDQIAAVMVEPVQSRKPEVQPRAFLTELRDVTRRHGTLLIFDEVVTGFRCHQGGAQAYFGVEADLATYGKVAAGNMPIGIVAGREEVMNTFDGGPWSFGDDSMPSAAVTFFAGTFVRHPLAIAACHAMLTRLVEDGPALQERLAERTTEFAGRVNGLFESFEAPFELPNFTSVMYLRNNDASELGSLFWHYLRYHGIFALDGFPSYLTLAHTDEVLDRVVDGVRSSLEEMVEAGLLLEPRRLQRDLQRVAHFPDKPAPDARLGADAEGRPGWFMVERGVPKKCRNGAPGAAVDFDPFAAGEFESVVVASESQQEVWSAAQLGDDASCAFNESVSLVLEGPFDAGAFRTALGDLLERHAMMRASLSPDGVFLKIARHVEPEVKLLDAATMSAKQFTEGDVSQPFDLVSGPLFRFAVIREAEDRHVFVMTAHHVVCDGWSSLLLLRELGNRYRANKGLEVEALAAADDPAEYNRLAADLAGTEAEDYWLDEFETIPPVIDLPADAPRPPMRTFDSRRLDYRVGPEKLDRYKALGKSLDSSLFTVLLAGWAAYVARITETRDIVIGIPSAGQLAAGMPNLVGHCVNLLPIRVQVDPHAPFETLLAAVKEKVTDALSHQEYTFGRLLKRLPLARDPSRVPLIPMQFNLDPPTRPDLLDFGGIAARLETNPRRFENFELFINIAEIDDGLDIQAQFNSNLFTQDSVRRRLHEYLTLLDSAVDAPQNDVGHLAVMDSTQRDRIVREFNLTESEFDTGTHFLELFAAQVARTPDSTALVCGEAALTYGELDRRATNLAAHLAGHLSDPEGSLVGVAMNRSIDMVVCLIAVWKVGAAYVPLDPEFPAERLAFMIDDSGIEVVLSASDVSIPGLEHGAETILLDRIDLDKVDTQWSPPSPDTARRAYVIYTSGSTGRPKGVQISHRAAGNFLQSIVQYPGFSAKDTLVAVTTLSFDIALLELFTPLLVGAKVVIAEKERCTDGGALVDLMTRHGATVMQATPATWRIVMETDWQPDNTFRALCGGEAFPADLASEMSRRCAKIFNMYGPTEATVWSAVYEVDPQVWREPPHAVVPVGRPIHNTQLYVLDEFWQPQPPGVPGELYIGGDGLAIGYLNREELTAERFVEHPEFGRLYKTGDRMRQDANGVLYFVERIDSQVKVRGFRIELGEIESALVTHRDVREAIVSVYEPAPGDARLAAYCVMQGDVALDPAAMREHLEQVLPRYMIPQHFTQLAEIKLTPNRKADRKALPAPVAVQAESVQPRNEAERIVADIWKRVLVVEEVSVYDDFFNLGGHSILATRVVAALRDQGIVVPIRSLFGHPVLWEFAEHVAASMLVAANEPVASGEREVLKF